MNPNEHVTQLNQFRQEVYQNFNKRADTLMNLLDALSSNTSAQTVVELSLNSAFQREYSALFTALDEWEPDKAAKNNELTLLDIFHAYQRRYDPQRPLSATHVQRDFGRIIRQFGTPAAAPKRHGNSPSRRKGTVFTPRPRPDIVYKGKT